MTQQCPQLPLALPTILVHTDVLPQELPKNPRAFLSESSDDWGPGRSILGDAPQW